MLESELLAPVRACGARPDEGNILTADQRAAGEAEWNQIWTAEPWEGTCRARQTLEWARRHPDDPRVPEALHRAVMATRYRGSDAEAGKYSQQAFALLHQRHPKSPWRIARRIGTSRLADLDGLGPIPIFPSLAVP